MQADYIAGAAEVDLAGSDRAAPGSGGEGEPLVRVTSGVASELHGEAQLVSPFGTWDMLGRGPGSASRRGRARCCARGERASDRTVTPVVGAVKVMYYGRVRSPRPFRLLSSRSTDYLRCGRTKTVRGSGRPFSA